MWRDDGFSPRPRGSQHRVSARYLAPPLAAPSAFLQGPYRFVLHYVVARPWQFAALLMAVAGAAGCAVAVQYVMKLLVDGMAGPREASAAVWSALILFVAFIAGESEFTPRNVQSVDERHHQVFAVKVVVDDPAGVFKAGMAADVFFPFGEGR